MHEEPLTLTFRHVDDAIVDITNADYPSPSYYTPYLSPHVDVLVPRVQNIIRSLRSVQLKQFGFKVWTTEFKSIYC
jgi:hypothetical protein